MQKNEFTFHALGTTCILYIVAPTQQELSSVVNRCYEQIIDFEKQFSRFLPESLLSKVNEHKKYEVTDEFLSLLHKAQEIYKLTQGYFNPLIDVRKIGYSHSFETQEFEKTIDIENIDFTSIKNYGTLLELSQYMNIDFGSIAKGYLAEKISKYLGEKGYRNNLVNLGGDIYVSGKNHLNEKWNVAIQSPFTKDFPLDVIALTDMSVSTSGSYLRKWKIQEKQYHHIRNPFSDEQEQELISATIIDVKGYKTDAFATACIAMGAEKALEFCNKNNIQYIFVFNSGKVLKNLQ